MRIPWLNAPVNSLHEIETRPNPRVFKTHDPAEWLDDIIAGSNAKIIFVHRGVRDVAVSKFENMKQRQKLKEIMGGVTFDEFYRHIFRDPGRCSYGLWEDHLVSINYILTNFVF